MDAEHLSMRRRCSSVRLGADHQRVQLVSLRGSSLLPEDVVEATEIAGMACATVVPKSRISLIWRRLLPAPAECSGNRASRRRTGNRAAGEQAVAADVLEDVGIAHAGREQRARHQVRPAVEVVPVVINHRRIAGRAARTVQADDIALSAAARKPQGKSRCAGLLVVKGSSRIASIDFRPFRRRLAEHDLLAIVRRGDRLPGALFSRLTWRPSRFFALDLFRVLFPEHKPSIKIDWKKPYKPGISSRSPPIALFQSGHARRNHLPSENSRQMGGIRKRLTATAKARSGRRKPGDRSSLNGVPALERWNAERTRRTGPAVSRLFEDEEKDHADASR